MLLDDKPGKEEDRKDNQKRKILFNYNRFQAYDRNLLEFLT